MNDFSLQPYDIVRPEKVQWMFPLKGEVIDSIPSSSLRKFLRTADDTLRENNIVVDYSEMSEEKYAEWYSFYSQNMEEKKYDVFASKSLIEEKKLEGKTVFGILLYRGDELVGGGIIIRKEKQWASLAYKASLRLSLGNKQNSSLGAIIDYLFVEKMKQEGVQSVTGGRSRNAFGVLNSFSHLEYKLRFGYVPFPDLESQSLTSVPLDEKEAVVFVGIQSGEKYLFLLRKKGVQVELDFSRFSTPQLPYKELEFI